MAIIVPPIFMLGVLLGKSSWRTLIYNISGVESKMSLFICMCFWWRWWAWTIIKNLSPEEMLQVRAKVATLECLKGQRADLGLQRAWEGNYLVSVILMKEFNKKEQQLKKINFVSPLPLCVLMLRSGIVLRQHLPSPWCPVTCRGKTSSWESFSPATFARYNTPLHHVLVFVLVFSTFLYHFKYWFCRSITSIRQRTEQC